MARRHRGQEAGLGATLTTLMHESGKLAQELHEAQEAMKGMSDAEMADPFLPQDPFKAKSPFAKTENLSQGSPFAEGANSFASSQGERVKRAKTTPTSGADDKPAEASLALD